MNALEGCMDAGRLARGRSYATPYRRTEFSIRRGRIEATIRGNVNAYFGVYDTPYYRVTIEFDKVPASKRPAIFKRLGANADWVTHLILGEVPPTVEKALAGSEVKLLPRTGKEIRSSCSCPDYANPCKHVAGVYYHVAALLDRDPLLLFELRGMDRAKLLQAVSQSDFGSALIGDVGPGDPDPASSAPEQRFPERGPERQRKPGRRPARILARTAGAARRTSGGCSTAGLGAAAAPAGRLSRVLVPQHLVHRSDGAPLRAHREGPSQRSHLRRPVFARRRSPATSSARRRGRRGRPGGRQSPARGRSGTRPRGRGRRCAARGSPPGRAG